MKSLLALLFAAAPVLAAPLESTQSLTGQVLLSVPKLTVADTSPDNAAPLIGDVLTPSLAAFDPALGVLVGVQGQLTIDPNHGLMAYRNESGGNWSSVSTLRVGWTVGARSLAPMTILQQVSSDRDTMVVIGTDWATLSFNTLTGLDGFVGSTPLTPSVTTYIGAFINGGGGGATAIASVLAMNDGVGGPDPDGLTAGLQWTYRWLRHAQLSFDGGAALSTLNLDLGGGSTAFSLHALGDGATTTADLLGWRCSGDCEAFSLQLDPATGLAAGSSLSGQASYLGGTGGHQATFWLDFADSAGTGAAASLGTQTLALHLEAPAAVPEANTAWMLLAGLASLSLMRRRRNNTRP